ncbi:hypothetical protein SAMN02745121_06506 [Nannocystis exedens]|uniref:DUF4276 family protein n=1 Tax=Nannocystis exedens TaxID=54 RepID=A0A1I2F8Y0_9BACT|nr:hypothetical protein [Nannocystis exedens]PCC73032.1 hypothetical protein NAEX_06118 [Nannocystis exedens]SFF01188.1 hypothetical protein SAMN02745121_06506 [Nannocystis exedens]
MRIALFVEGSAPLGSKDHCSRLWNGTLLPALGRAPVDLVVPIGKDAISRLRGLRTSTSAPGLDAKIQALAAREKLDPGADALVIAWDLEPIDRQQRRCAWDEKLGLYRGLAESPLLQGSGWARDARRRADALERFRGRAPRGLNHSRVVPGSVLALCMEPMFEALLARDGRAVRRALGLDADPPGWPTGWGRADLRDPSAELLEPAIAALRRLRPRPPVRRHIHETWANAKDEWGEYILRQLFTDAPRAAELREHPIARRLAHLLPPAS